MKEIPIECPNLKCKAYFNLQSHCPYCGRRLMKRLKDVERAYIFKALEISEGHITKAGELIGVSKTNMYLKVRQYGYKNSQSRRVCKSERSDSESTVH